MIDLINGSNGNTNNGNSIPCPSCSELAAIHEILHPLAIYDGEPPITILSMLLSELKMWRAKEEYEKKLKSVVTGAMLKKMEDGDDAN